MYQKSLTLSLFLYIANVHIFARKRESVDTAVLTSQASYDVQLFVCNCSETVPSPPVSYRCFFPLPSVIALIKYYYQKFQLNRVKRPQFQGLCLQFLPFVRGSSKRFGCFSKLFYYIFVFIYIEIVSTHLFSCSLAISHLLQLVPFVCQVLRELSCVSRYFVSCRMSHFGVVQQSCPLQILPMSLISIPGSLKKRRQPYLLFKNLAGDDEFLLLSQDG